MIYAYANFNLGDDLFIKILCERYPNTEFILYAPKSYKKLFEDLKNLRIFPSDNFVVRGANLIFRLVNGKNRYIQGKIAEKCDAAVYIGGSIFMQDANWERKLENRKNSLIKDKPTFILGANFGPFNDEKFLSAYKKFFSKITDICFRDNYSYELFQELPNIRVADDIIFQLTREKKNPTKNKKVVISVIKPSIREHLVNYDEIYYEKIKETTIFLTDKGLNVTLMSFCENEGDKEAIKEIFNLLPNKNKKMVEKHYYKYNLKETIRTIESSKFVIATRFHSMILGWLFRKPVFPIAYSEKMTNVMKDLNFTGKYVELTDIDKLDPVEVFKSMETNIVDVSKQIENSRNHFKELDKLLLDK